MLSLNLNRRIILIFSACLVSLFGFSLYLFQRGQQAEVEAIRRQWANRGESFGMSIGAQFFERYGDVQAFADNHVFRDGKPADIATALNHYINLYRIYDLLIYADLKGNIIASSSQDADGRTLEVSELFRMNVAQTPWFLAAAAEKYTEDASKHLTGSYVEDIQIDPITSKIYKAPQIGLSFSTAVHNAEGRIIGVLSSRSSLRWLEKEVVDLYANIADEGLPQTELTLLNRRGELVVDYDPFFRKTRELIHDFDALLKINLAQMGQPAAQAVLRGEHGIMEAVHLRKRINQLNIYLPIKDDSFLDSMGWSFILRADDSELFGGVYEARRMFYGAMGVMLLVCLLAAGLFASRISLKLKGISSGIGESGRAVDGYSRQLSQASEGLASSATEVASSLEETVASLEELVSMVKINAENSEEAAKLAKSSSQTAKEGEREVQSLIVAINDISQSSRKIEEIINVIDDIAFQTNLLALNAAVEAARAGDQGRGFAVVAEAVRNLAQRSGTAAKEITKLIQDNGDKIEQGTRIADRSGQVLQNILKSATKVADLNQEIAAASHEQSTGLTQISKAMNEIDQATQRNAAASEQVSTSSGELKGRADALKAMVSQLSELVTGKTEMDAADALGRPAVESAASNVTSIRPAQRRNRSLSIKAPSAAKDLIPFDDEPKAKISGTQGF